ncbi:methylamine utilization protein [Aquabacterium sp.]|jgi:plastocyanin|uniref:methylamine utilization protein n=1 Tax=Aquabacterium sp. TaxID=1872578 RepID=UPI0011D36B76|nr:methylamine utilization protein [Aquabacterium sp.]MBP6614517.1 methylamine utilization protein [Aquabacterium sp.]MBP7502966.1 methylamine utilization protein [Aquabacterium sp.]MCC6219458.1 methylamine utilization protein [Aquabacterium sp.]MDD2975974.1 methylamine utilization protein [Aquabacterium sp.]TXI94802.1 MAG: methylamine utilization protein [Aquabacterium sp.]
MRLAWGLLAGVTGTLGAGGALAAPHTIVVRNEAGQPVHPAAVSVFVDGTPARAAKGAQGQMAQRDKAFAPTLLVVQTGTPVSFPNFDTVRHHVYSFSPTKPFELKLYAGTPVAPVVFDRAGTATLGCNIHDRMLGYIHVVETPYFGQTDGQGRVVLDLPEGHHRLKVWTPTMGEKHPGLPFPIDTRTRTTRVTLPP